MSYENMGYVIQRREDKKYHCDPSTHPKGHAFTERLENAKRYATYEKAKKDLCPVNETIRFVGDLLEPQQ